MKYKTIREGLLKLFTLVFIITFIYIVYIAIFNCSIENFKINSIGVFVGSVFLILILYILDKYFVKLDEHVLFKVRIFSIITMIFLQIAFIIFLRVGLSWDYGAINNAAFEFALGKEMLPDYFYLLYPNNIGSTLFLGYIYKFISIFTNDKEIFLRVGIILNLLMINLSIFTTYFLIDKIFGESRATLFSVFSLTITPLYAYSQIVYTDTLTMFFPVGMLLLLYIYNENTKHSANSKYRKILYLIGIGILGVIGTNLKTNIVICLIAIIIFLLLTSSIFDGIKGMTFILLPFIVGSIIIHSIFSLYIPVSYKDAGLPYTHWIMMGLSGAVGSYSEDDVAKSREVKEKYGKEATAEYNKNVIKSRLKEFGVSGYTKFLKQKTSLTWGDGTYYSTNKLGRLPLKKTDLYYHVVEGNNDVFVYISQISHTVLMSGILIAAIGYYKKSFDFIKVLLIAIFGVFLFLILWETRPRYLVCFLPVIIITAFYGLDCIFKFIDKIRSPQN
jgi:hypothetical protein